MKLVVLACLAGIVLSTSSFTNTDSVERISQEIPNPSLKSILKKKETTNTIREKSDLRVRFNSACKWSGIDMRQFREITSSSVRMFLQETMNDINCTLYYRVDNNDGGKLFFLFRIDLQNRVRRPSVYGIISSDDGSNFTWKASRRKAIRTLCCMV